jgi:hypothetical protein
LAPITKDFAWGFAALSVVVDKDRFGSKGVCLPYDHPICQTPNGDFTDHLSIRRQAGISRTPHVRRLRWPLIRDAFTSCVTFARCRFHVPASMARCGHPDTRRMSLGDSRYFGLATRSRSPPHTTTDYEGTVRSCRGCMHFLGHGGIPGKRLFRKAPERVGTGFWTNQFYPNHN